MLQRHKHYDVLVAYAEGHEIQFLSKVDNTWVDCGKGDLSPISFPEYNWRVKPTPKPDVTILANVCQASPGRVGFGLDSCVSPNVCFTFDGETGKLKSAEVL